MSRDNFTKKTVETLAKRVGYKCSYPNCNQVTSGPHSNPNKALNIGVACHITAASPNGPRYDSSLSSDERKSIVNGIWMCQNHAKLIDIDENTFSVMQLIIWKSKAEQNAGVLVMSDTSDYRHATEDKELPLLEKQGFDFDENKNITVKIISKSAAVSSAFKTIDEVGFPVETNYGSIFKIIGPHIGQNSPSETLRTKIGRKDLKGDLASLLTFANASCIIAEDSWAKLEFYFEACAMITVSKRQNERSDLSIWSITRKGKDYLMNTM